ncbi:MAG: DapH/DapD/GlmU-related protein [Casimicrobium sp.]
MIGSWSDFRCYVHADATGRGSPISLRNIVFDPVLRFQILMRLDEWLLNTGKPKLLRYVFLLWFRRLSVRLGFSMGPNIFGPGLAIVHYGTIVIDPTTRIGKNCRIHVGSHIGGAAQFVDAAEVHKYSPRVGDNVYIGPGAKLYGPIVIGDNCVIGANAVVTKSFPQAGLTLAGVPAKVIGEGGTGDRVVKAA